MLSWRTDIKIVELTAIFIISGFAQQLEATLRMSSDAKRAPEATNPALTAESEPDAKKPSLETPIDPAVETAKLKALLAKLTAMLPVDKKCIKAAGVVVKTIETSLTAANAETDFYPVVELLQQRDVKFEELGTELSAAYQAIFNALDAHITCFPPTLRYDIETSYLLHSHRLKLATDDSFRYAAATKRVLAGLEKLSWAFSDRTEDAEGVPVPDVASKPLLSAEQKDRRCRAVIMLLNAMASQWHRAWARPSFEQACKLNANHRLLFTDALREELDELNDQLKARRSTSTMGGKKTATHQIRGGYANWSS